MLNYSRSVWNSRYFLLSLVANDLQARYRRSALGMLWSLLHPIAMTSVICTVFHNLFHQDIREFAPFLLAGLSVWGFISHTVMQGCHCYYQAEVYIRQHPTPLAIYPLRVTLAGGFHLLLALAVSVVLTWCLQGFNNVPVLISLIPTLLLLFILGWSLAALMGVANVYFPDTAHLAEVALQIMFYVTPVMYPPDLLRSRGLGWLVDCNPLTSLLELIRHPILTGELPSVAMFAAATLGVGMVALAAVLILRRLHSNLVFHL